MPVSTETSAFLTWFQEWGQVVYFFAQVLFWVAIAAAAVMIAFQYKRFVDYKSGKAAAKLEKKAAKEAAQAAAPQAAPAPAAAIEIDKFVE